MCIVHVSLVPIIGVVGEQKTKPTQHSVAVLRSLGLHPDLLACRCSEPLDDSVRQKLVRHTKDRARGGVEGAFCMSLLGKLGGCLCVCLWGGAPCTCACCMLPTVVREVDWVDSGGARAEGERAEHVPRQVCMRQQHVMLSAGLH